MAEMHCYSQYRRVCPSRKQPLARANDKNSSWKHAVFEPMVFISLCRRSFAQKKKYVSCWRGIYLMWSCWRCATLLLFCHTSTLVLLVFTNSTMATSHNVQNHHHQHADPIEADLAKIRTMRDVFDYCNKYNLCSVAQGIYHFTN